MKTFEDYWKMHNNVYEKLGVTKDVAFMIWCAAIDAMTDAIRQEVIKENI